MNSPIVRVDFSHFFPNFESFEARKQANRYSSVNSNFDPLLVAPLNLGYVTGALPSNGDMPLGINSRPTNFSDFIYFPPFLTQPDFSGS